ncbi:MAG: MarR family winged helix-turn-helix transcriptional regulator [Gemmataceae bacterium]
MKEERDVVDELLAAWKVIRPDVDAHPLGVVGRVILLARHLEKDVEAALAKHELSLGQFDILATLRRNGGDTGMTPGQLLEAVMLSSGGMTNRLDRLEQAGLIARQADPDDRRGIRVRLTAKGRRVIDAATVTRMDSARDALPPISARDRAQLEKWLRVWLLRWAED